MDVRLSSEIPSVGRANEVCKTNGFLAELAPNRVTAFVGRIALVEEEIDHLKYGVEAPWQLAAGYLERESELTDLLLRSNETLRNGRRLRQERARALADTETRYCLQRQGDATLSRQARMTSHEHEPYDVIDVAKRVIVILVSLVAARVIETEGVGQLFRLAGEDALALEDVERAILRHLCQPRGWILGNAIVGPDF